MAQVYQGMFGDWDSHTPMYCTTGGLTEKMLVPGLGDKYFLIVPTSVNSEGSHGTDSDGTERPPGPSVCRPQVIGECP